MVLQNQRGTSMIETVILAPVFGIMIGLGAVMIYVAYAKVWMSRNAREAAVCLASPSPPSLCRSRLERDLRLGLPFGAPEIREFKSTFNWTRVSLRLGFERSQRSKSPDLRAVAIFHRPKYFPLED
jgi:hypothetical protein